MSDVSHTERSIRTRQTLRILVGVVLAAAVVVFALLNTQTVAVDWAFGVARTTMWVVIAACAGIGFLTGYLTRARRS